MSSEPSGFLIEFVSLGNAVKATAIDPATGVEASIVGPVRADREALGRAAVHKLRHVLSRKAG